jgi:hypothetical protein
MKKTLLPAILVFMILTLPGCGNEDNNARPVFVTQILSDPAIDGYITQNTSTTFTVTQGMTLTPPAVQSVLAGIDPASSEESRAFLDFPLTGTNGVPGNAIIVSATIDIVLNNVFLQAPGDTIPIRIELVPLPSLTLVQDDFDRDLLPAITFTTIVPPISSADAGHHVAVDVTSLMVQAQNLGLPDFQVRILEDLGAPHPGLIDINDTTIDPTTRGALAPLLQVQYF